jgi:O-succinylbenzoate synthase
VDFTLIVNTSASSRSAKQDIAVQFAMNDIYLTVPTGDGVGVTPDMNFLNPLQPQKR